MVRQLVIESMLLALLGGAVGVLLAQWALGAVVALGADLIPRAVEIRLDPMALVFSLLVTLVTGLAIGLLPALQAARVNVNETLKEASRGSTAAGQRLRASLLVAEVSLSLVLLIAAGLLLQASRVFSGSSRVSSRRASSPRNSAAAAALRRRQAGRILRAAVKRLATLPAARRPRSPIACR